MPNRPVCELAWVVGEAGILDDEGETIGLGVEGKTLTSGTSRAGVDPVDPDEDVETWRPDSGLSLGGFTGETSLLTPPLKEYKRFERVSKIPPPPWGFGLV